MLKLFSLFTLLVVCGFVFVVSMVYIPPPGGTLITVTPNERSISLMAGKISDFERINAMLENPEDTSQLTVDGDSVGSLVLTTQAWAAPDNFSLAATQFFGGLNYKQAILLLLGFIVFFIISWAGMAEALPRYFKPAS